MTNLVRSPLRLLARHPWRPLAWIVAAALTPVLVGGTALLVATRLSALPDGAALRAGGQVISAAALDQRVKLIKALYGMAPPEELAARDTYRRQAARSVATAMVLDQAARERGVVITDADARASLEKMVTEGLPDGRAGFIQLLSVAGASEPDVLAEIKRQEATTRLFEQVTAAVGEVSEDAARAYYTANPARFVQPETRRPRNIVVSSEAEAARLLDRARGGADFAELARRESLDESTAPSGGDLGFVYREQLAPEYAETVFTADAGALLGPVRTEHGWNVGQLLEVRPARPVPFEVVRDQLRGQLRWKQKLDEWRNWVSARVAAADVEYADEYRSANSPTSGNGRT